MLTAEQKGAYRDWTALHSHKEEEEEESITSGNWRGKHNSLSRGAVAPAQTQYLSSAAASMKERDDTLSDADAIPG